MRVLFGLLFFALAVGLVHRQVFAIDQLLGRRLALMAILVTGSLFGAGLAFHKENPVIFRKCAGAASLLASALLIAFMANTILSDNSLATWQYVIYLYYAAFFGLQGGRGVRAKRTDEDD